MELTYVSQANLGTDIRKKKALFETAFPPEERPPFWLMLEWNRPSFYGVYLEGEFIGLADMIQYEDLAYLFFLAIKKKWRNKGIGTQILRDFKNKFPDKRLFLLADEVGEEYPDNEVRIRRIGFYERNGFHYQGTKVKEMGVTYQMMVCGDPVSKEDFYHVMESLIGPDFMKKYYADL